MRRRNHIGSRIHRATVNQHDGTVDAHGNPTLSTAGDWDAVVSNWPVKVRAVTAGEVLRGRQVTAGTTHVMTGDYQAASSITTDMQAVVTSAITNSATTYEIVSVLDVEGDGRELIVELKRET